MIQYISKAAVVAEIERLKDIADKRFDSLTPIEHPETVDEECLKYMNEVRESKKNWLDGQSEAYKKLLSFLNTLEVKELDLEKWVESYWEQSDLSWCKDAYSMTRIRSMVSNIAEYFFELGLKTQDWKEQRMKECPYRKVGCTMYAGTILECRGVCSWVVDYPKLKELEARKGE